MENDAKGSLGDEADPYSKLRVGITYNLKKGIRTEVVDAEAEYDSIDTVLAIKNALEGDNCHVELMEADSNLPKRLQETPVDIVFNIAEGLKGRGREAEVPAVLNMFNIPFTGSDETTLCLALDKALCKRVLSTYRIRTPKYRVFTKDDNRLNTKFSFPCIVKPNAEGSSKGISDICIATNKEELKTLVSNNIKAYGQDMLVEEYIDGREFTVGVLGNGDDIHVFSPMEIIYLKKNNKFNIYSYNVKQDYKKLIRYECPPNLDPKIEEEMITMAKKIFKVLHCHDFSRVDFRLNSEGKPYFIEINPLPGLAPGYSDFPMLAEFCGMDYVTLVRSILRNALQRNGLPFHI